MHPTGTGAHLAKVAPAWHPGLNVELAVGGKAQFLGGHVQDPAAMEKGEAKVRVRGGRKMEAMEEKAAKSGQWKKKGHLMEAVGGDGEGIQKAERS